MVDHLKETIMYKRITHSILEEHFDECPTTPEEDDYYGYELGSSRKRKKVKPNLQQMLPPAIRYRFLSNFLFYDHLWYLQEAVDDIMLNNSAKKELLASKVAVAASNISNPIRNTFGPDAGDMMAEHMRVFSQLLLDLVSAIKSGASTTAVKSQLVQQINTIANFLTSKSSSLWTVDDWVRELDAFVNLVGGRVDAIKDGNWNVELTKRDELRDHVLRLAEYYSAGQIAPQYS